MREKSMHTTLPWNNRTEWKFAPNEYVVDVCVFAYKWMYKIEELSFDQNTKKKIVGIKHLKQQDRILYLNLKHKHKITKNV